MHDSNIAIQAEHLIKRYQLGVIGATTLRRDVQSRLARLRGEEDPNVKLGVVQRKGILHALDDVSFTIHKGERVGLIGHNGAGKSTLLKLLCRITTPTEGVIGINGKVTSMLEVGTGFHAELTGRENVYLNGAILGMTRKEIDACFNEILEFSEIGDAIDTPVKRYSSGMYIRLAFAVSAHLNADIVIMDEVLAVGDLAFQEKCIERMRQIAQEKNRTVIYVSHNMETVRALCDRCMVLDHGKIVFDGDTLEAERVYRTGMKSETVHDYSQEHNHMIGTTEEARIVSVNSLSENDMALTDDLALHIAWEYTQPLENLNLRIEIRNSEHAPVGSKLFYNIGSGSTGTVLENDFFVDISSLQNGAYHTIYTLFQVDSAGNGTNVDMVHGLDFTIRNDKRDTPLIWHPEWWGNVRL